MKDILRYILEKSDDEKFEKERGKIKFVIWKSPEEKLSWLEDGEQYQKIEAKYEEKPDAYEGIKVSFLLGQDGDDWKLWVGKPGVVSYSDDPYCDLECKSFKDAILKALDKAEKILKEIEEQPNNWVQYYVDR